MRAPVGNEDTILLAAHTQILYYDPTLRSIFESENSDSETGIAHVLHAGVSHGDALVAATSSVERQRFLGYCPCPVSALWALRAEGLP